MSNHPLYFSNHNKALRFPWSIYHRPLVNSLEFFLKSFDPNKAKTILIIGPGDLQELPLLLHYGFRPSLLDIDERTLDNLGKLHPGSIELFYHVDENFNGYPEDQKFDAVFAKEVIEHIPDTHAFLQQLKNVLNPKGKVWLSTPNYGFFLLALLEYTILEIVARFSGFSRRHIHPNKFTSVKLRTSLTAEGFGEVKVETTFAKLALCGTGTLT